MIEPHKLHETDLADALMNNVLHFLVRRCGGHPCCEFDHVRPADRPFHHRYNGVKGLPGGETPPLKVDLTSLDIGFPQAVAAR
jgi:hypothetical protein